MLRSRRAWFDLQPGVDRECFVFIDGTGAELCFLPPYSPDFNSIEMAFSKLRAFLRKAPARTKDALWEAIQQSIDAITPTECANFFSAAEYVRD
ncbi:transposase (plasmid) [Azospirillum sp. A26]|uniref:transposase n=1 Tax=Azospirillum sp. A26 TaxID=3160607 RepID=UPI00366AC966